MESKNLFLFVFIFFINIKLLVSNEEYGTISFFDMDLANTDGELEFIENVAKHSCKQGACTISFKIAVSNCQIHSVIEITC